MWKLISQDCPVLGGLSLRLWLLQLILCSKAGSLWRAWAHLKALHEVLPGWAPARGLEPSHLTRLSPPAICLLFPFSLFRQLRAASQGPQTPTRGRTCWSALLEIPCVFREKRQSSPLKRGEASLCYKPCTPTRQMTPHPPAPPLALAVGGGGG